MSANDDEYGKTGKVIPLRRVPGADVGIGRFSGEPAGRFGRAKGALALAFVSMLKGVRYTLFLVLLWLRPLVRIVGTLASGPTMIAFLLCLLLVPESNKHRETILWALGGVSLGGFLLMWFYDTVLLMLSPEPIMLS